MKFSYLRRDSGAKSVLSDSHTGIDAAAVCKTKVLILAIFFFYCYSVVLHIFFFSLKIFTSMPNEVAKSGARCRDVCRRALGELKACAAAHQTKSTS